MTDNKRQGRRTSRVASGAMPIHPRVDKRHPSPCQTDHTHITIPAASYLPTDCTPVISPSGGAVIVTPGYSHVNTPSCVCECASDCDCVGKN